MAVKTKPPKIADDTARRPMAAGRIWLVLAIALLVGGILNAPGLRKTALGQPLGWQRDVAIFLSDRLNEVSNPLFLDQPRAGLQALAGRSGDDDVDLSLPSPTRPVNPQLPPKVPVKKSFSPLAPLKVAIAGDSLSITPGESLINLSPATGSIATIGSVDGHISTGLARLEVFNWPAHLSEVISAGGLDAVVLTLGSNDDQNLTGDGGVGPLLSPEWETEYRRRVGGLMDLVNTKGATLFWVAIPPMSNDVRYDTRYKPMNEIVRSEAAKRPGKVVLVETDPVLTFLGSGYAQYLPTADGGFIQIRTGDGIHFTRAGGDLVAEAVLAAMRTTFDLDSWRTPSTTSASKKGATTTTRPTSTTTEVRKKK